MLMVTMITCLIIGTVLASFLVLISRRYNMTIRSAAWNAAMPVLEAGIEEGLAHLQADSNPAANGWIATTIGGQPVHIKTRNLEDGSYYVVMIYNASSENPTLYSSGYVPGPTGDGYLTRLAKVTATRPKSFSAAIAASGLVTLSAGATVDSYNSCLGPYSPTNSMGTNGSIATNYGATPAIKVVGGHVYGTTTTGPGGTVDTGGGAVGDKDWNATHTGIESGWSGDTMNVAFPSNAPPPGPYLSAPVINAGGSNITALASGTYLMASFSSGLSTKPMIVSGNAVVYCQGNFLVSGTGYVKLLPGATLRLYVGGIGSLSGGGLINVSGHPADFTYFGLPSNNNLTISGSSAFFGTINAPQAACTMSGLGGAYGAAIVKSYSSSGGSSFHYDECLSVATNNLVMTSWREL